MRIVFLIYQLVICEQVYCIRKFSYHSIFNLPNKDSRTFYKNLIFNSWN